MHHPKDISKFVFDEGVLIYASRPSSLDDTHESIENLPFHEQHNFGIDQLTG
jgi:hypothetical protein